MIPDPKSLIDETTILPEVEQLGTISVETLNIYRCDNPDRRLLSLNGIVYDGTTGKNYGPNGAYKDYAGHDITLALALHKTDTMWLDRFVYMKEKWKETANGWEDYFKSKYPIAGNLINWDTDPETWPHLSSEELEKLEKCCIM